MFGNTNYMMISTAYCKNKHCGRNEGLINVQVGGTHSDHCLNLKAAMARTQGVLFKRAANRLLYTSYKPMKYVTRVSKVRDNSTVNLVYKKDGTCYCKQLCISIHMTHISIHMTHISIHMTQLHFGWCLKYKINLRHWCREQPTRYLCCRPNLQGTRDTLGGHSKFKPNPYLCGHTFLRQQLQWDDLTALINVFIAAYVKLAWPILSTQTKHYSEQALHTQSSDVRYDISCT